MNNLGIAYTDRPISMQAYVKGIIKPGGNALIVAKLRKWNTTTHVRDNIGMAVYNMDNSIANYTQISVPFNYSSNNTPDTLEIMIMAGNGGPGALVMPGNEFFVDDISFTFPTNGINELGKDKPNITFYPNPSSSEISIQTKTFFENATLTVYNSFGQQVKQIKNISGQRVTLHRDNLPSGMYFIRITQENKIISVEKVEITD